MIKNIFILLALAIFLGSILVGGISYFSYNYEVNYNANVAIKGISSDVSVHWRDDRTPIIEANSEPDLMSGLGYSHALRHGLSMLLLRQTAIGELNTWYGAPVVPIDRHAQTLGFAATARNAFYNLPEAQKRLLVQYANGINSVFDEKNNNLPEDLILSKLKRDKWEAWHSLAVEHLLAWLGTEEYPHVPSDTTKMSKGQKIESDLDQFVKDDRQMRDFLKYNGFEHSLAWTAKQSGNTFFFQRHVTGASAHPLLQEVVLKWQTRTVKVASIPGTLMFPSGQSERVAWHISLTANRSIEKLPAKADSAVAPAYSKLVDQDGNETLVTVKRNQNALFIPEEVKFKKTKTIHPKMIPIWKKVYGKVRKIMIQADSTEKIRDIQIDTSYANTWAIRWTGFENRSDTDSWLRLMRGDTTNVRFSLFKGNGMISSKTGSYRILGNPSVREPLPDGVLVTDSPWGKFVADRVRSLIQNGQPLDTVLEKNVDMYSTWATPIAKKALALMLPRKDHKWQSKEALTYLRNWQHTFEATSIPATIFDMWMSKYAKRSGKFIADTTAFTGIDSLAQVKINQNLKETLEKTTQELYQNTDLKKDMTQWLWSNGQASYAFYPHWTTPYLPNSKTRLASTKFAPVNTGDGGHSTTLHWRATRIGFRKPAPMSFEAWTNSKQWRYWNIQHPNMLHEGMLARYSFATRLQVIALPDDVVDHVVATTTLFGES